MSQITIDANLISKLTANAAPVELVDEKGRIVGQFTPALDLENGELSPEETQRRLAPGRKRYTTEEVLAHLRNLK